MKRLVGLSFLLIACVLGAWAEDSITVSAADLQALVKRIERLEQRDSVSQNKGIEAKAESQESKAEKRRGRFTLGGYGEVTAKHCF